MATSKEEMNGFPNLEREPITLDDLPDRPSPIELARAYATIVIAWFGQWPKVVDALHWLYGRCMGIELSIDKAHKEVMSELKDIRVQLGIHREKLPSLSEYHPENTHGGGIRVTQEAWQAVQLKMQEQAEEKIAGDARVAGANDALATLDAANKKLRERIAFYVLLAGAIGGGLKWLASVFHLF
jgi:hypothetical protein